MPSGLALSRTQITGYSIKESNSRPQLSDTVTGTWNCTTSCILKSGGLDPNVSFQFGKSTSTMPRVSPKSPQQKRPGTNLAVNGQMRKVPFWSTTQSGKNLHIISIICIQTLTYLSSVLTEGLKFSFLFTKFDSFLTQRVLIIRSHSS